MKNKYKPVQQRANQKHKDANDYNRKVAKSIPYDEYGDEDMDELLSFQEYQIQKEQLFDAESAFNAAVKMCEEYYNAPEEEQIELEPKADYGDSDEPITKEELDALENTEHPTEIVEESFGDKLLESAERALEHAKGNLELKEEVIEEADEVLETVDEVEQEEDEGTEQSSL